MTDLHESDSSQKTGPFIPCQIHAQKPESIITMSDQFGQETKISKNVLTSTKYGVEFQDHEIQLKFHSWAKN